MPVAIDHSLAESRPISSASAQQHPQVLADQVLADVVILDVDDSLLLRQVGVIGLTKHARDVR
jgi:hypothetical protein